MNLNEAMAIVYPLHEQTRARLEAPALSAPETEVLQGRDLVTVPVRGTRDYVLLRMGDARAAFALKRSEWEPLAQALEAGVWCLPAGTMEVNGRRVAGFGNDV